MAAKDEALAELKPEGRSRRSEDLACRPLEDEERRCSAELNTHALSCIPNIPLDDVPNRQVDEQRQCRQAHASGEKPRWNH